MSCDLGVPLALLLLGVSLAVLVVLFRSWRCSQNRLAAIETIRALSPRSCSICEGAWAPREMETPPCPFCGRDLHA